MDEQETRRLLELAAKAVGLRIKRKENDYFIVWIDGEPMCWSPLRDDGDSRRLEVALEMIVDNFIGEVRVKIGWSHGSPDFHTERIQTTGDRAATRLAVLRAAAAIGESMQERGIAGFKSWPATHLKSGNEYRVIGEAIDATNATEGRTMVIYRGNGHTFVREVGEFTSKFASMKGG